MLCSYVDRRLASQRLRHDSWVLKSEYVFSRVPWKEGVLQARKLACTRHAQEGMEDFVCNVAGAEAEGARGTNAAPQVVKPYIILLW